jgi:hypothetical protein
LGSRDPDWDGEVRPSFPGVVGELELLLIGLFTATEAAWIDWERLRRDVWLIGGVRAVFVARCCAENSLVVLQYVLLLSRARFFSLGAPASKRSRPSLASRPSLPYGVALLTSESECHYIPRRRD